jgi:pimeloyl-ACP methyl ester carboxylesterase
MGALAVARRGSGPEVLLIHGSIVDGEVTFRQQLPLAERWTLVIPSRPGFGASEPAPGGGDFEAEGPLMAELLSDSGTHLVGHSYGAVIALFAAAARPGSVRSLTISEPGCLRVAAGVADVARAIENGDRLYANAEALGPMGFLRYFRGGVGSSHHTPEHLQGGLLHGAELAMRERPAWHAEPPWLELREAPFRKLVISGGHSPVFEAVCDEVTQRLGAQRATVSGRSHSIPATGAPYNECLEAFLSECESLR